MQRHGRDSRETAGGMQGWGRWRVCRGGRDGAEEASWRPTPSLQPPNTRTRPLHAAAATTTYHAHDVGAAAALGKGCCATWGGAQAATATDQVT